MARPPWYNLPHTFYHVLSRGNEKQAIFKNDADREKFLSLLSRLPERFGIEIWNYVLLDNHYHLLLKNVDGNLSRAMQWLGTSYTSYFNWKWGRSGHLFRGRFKSFVVEEESYLRQLVLYIHRNPLRARMDKQQKRGMKRTEGPEKTMEDVRMALRLSVEEFEDLKRPVRGIVRAMRDIAICLIWKQGSFPLAEIGEKFHVGYTSISNARIRGEVALREDRKVRSMLKDSEIDI